jgi:hypothetical protein
MKKNLKKYLSKYKVFNLLKLINIVISNYVRKIKYLIISVKWRNINSLLALME